MLISIDVILCLFWSIKSFKILYSSYEHVYQILHWKLLRVCECVRAYMRARARARVRTCVPVKIPYFSLPLLEIPEKDGLF